MNYSHCLQCLSGEVPKPGTIVSMFAQLLAQWDIFVDSLLYSLVSERTFFTALIIHHDASFLQKNRRERPESKVSSVLQLLTQAVASFRDFKSTAMVARSCELHVHVSLGYQSKSSKSLHLFCPFVLVNKEEGPSDGYIFAGAFFSLRVMKDHQQ